MPYEQRPASLPLVVEECRTAIWLERGNITKAAERLKVSSSRLRNFVKNSPRLQEEVNEAREQLKDIAEDIVYEALTDGADASRRDKAAFFVLTHLGGDRGFGSSKSGAGVNLNLPKGGSIRIQWEDGATLSGPPNDNAVIDQPIKDVTPA